MKSKFLYRKLTVLIAFSCFVLLVIPLYGATDSSTGGIMGFVYGKDGKSPLQNAVVMLKGINTKTLYQSEPTGATGAYRMPGIAVGTYVVGLKVNENLYNVNDYINISKGKTDTLSLSLHSPAPPAPRAQETGAAAPAVTKAASRIGMTSATLNGTVYANNVSTTVTFQYGTDTNYGGTVTADQSPVTGTSITAVSKSVIGLSPATRYHYRVVAENSSGTTYGADMTFTTRGAAVAFFKKPLGIAVIVAGTAVVGFGLYKLLKKKEEKEASPTQR